MDRTNKEEDKLVTFILTNYIDGGKMNNLRRQAFQQFIDHHLNGNKFSRDQKESQEKIIFCKIKTI